MNMAYHNQGVRSQKAIQLIYAVCLNQIKKSLLKKK